jgi:hypothetical protein
LGEQANKPILGLAMLNINPETVCFIISKAREFHAKEEVVIPEVAISSSIKAIYQVLGIGGRTQ